MPRVNSLTLDEFVLVTLEDLRGKEAKDNITPQHPLMTRMKEHGGIEDRDPGLGPTEDVLYATPSRGVTTSQSAPYAQKDETETTGYTRAKYDWVQRTETMVLSNYEITNNRGVNKLYDLVKRKRRIATLAQQSALFTIMWAGTTNSSENVFGVKELIQFDPTSAPTRGNPGNIDPTGDDTTWWRNRYKDYDTAYVTYTTGAQNKTMVEDPGSTSTMTNVWFECTDNPQGLAAEGQPDLMPCNAVFYQQYSDLIARRMVFAPAKDRYELGVDGLWYKSGVIFYDSSVPAAPTAGEGVCFFINSRTLKWVYAKGLREDWGPGHALSRAITGRGWDMTTQFSMTCDSRNRNGVFFGSKAASIS